MAIPQHSQRSMALSQPVASLPAGAHARCASPSPGSPKIPPGLRPMPPQTARSRFVFPTRPPGALTYDDWDRQTFARSRGSNLARILPKIVRTRDGNGQWPIRSGCARTENRDYELLGDPTRNGRVAALQLKMSQSGSGNLGWRSRPQKALSSSSKGAASNTSSRIRKYATYAVSSQYSASLRVTLIGRFQ